jgi:hypothetical protein
MYLHNKFNASSFSGLLFMTPCNSRDSIPTAFILLYSEKKMLKEFAYFSKPQYYKPFKALELGVTTVPSSQWPRRLRRRSAAARLLGLRVRIPPGAWMSVCCECCVLSGRGLCVGLITNPEESYRVWCVWVWSWSLDNEEALAHWGLLCHCKKKVSRRLRLACRGTAMFLVTHSRRLTF